MSVRHILERADVYNVVDHLYVRAKDGKFFPKDWFEMEQILRMMERWRTNFRKQACCWDIDVTNYVKDVEWDLYWLFMNYSHINFEWIWKWNMSEVVRIDNMFYGQKEFNENINDWDTSNVLSMVRTFYNCQKFNKPLNKWNVEKVINMNEMFLDCINFNQPLNNWNPKKLNNTKGMFTRCEKFNQDIQRPNNRINNAENMFCDCDVFDWDVSWLITNNTTNIISMFESSSAFTGKGVETWDVSNILYANHTFHDAWKFDWDISWWKFHNLAKAQYFLIDAKSFLWRFPFESLHQYLNPESNTNISDYDLYQIMKWVNKKSYNYFIWWKMYSKKDLERFISLFFALELDNKMDWKFKNNIIYDFYNSNGKKTLCSHRLLWRELRWINGTWRSSYVSPVKVKNFISLWDILKWDFYGLKTQRLFVGVVDNVENDEWFHTIWSKKKSVRDLV